MRLAEAAALLAVSPSTLRRWGDAGKVACRRTPGGQRRFVRAEIESWIANRPLPPSQTCSLRLDDFPREGSSPTAAAELRTLVDASLEFGRTLDLDEVIVSVACRLRTVADAATCDIYANEQDGARILVSVDGDVVHEAFGGVLYPSSEFFLTAEQRLRQEPIEVFDIETQVGVSKAEREAWLEDDFHSGLLLPLIADGEQIGAALLLDHEPRRFPHLALLQGLAQLAAQALTNAALHRDLAAHDRRADLVNESSLAFASSLKPQEVFLATAQRLCVAIDVPNCDIYSLTGPDELTCEVSVVDYEAHPAWPGERYVLHEWAMAQLAVQTRTTLAVASAQDRRLNELERRDMREYGERSFMAVPLFAKDSVIGLIYLLESRTERTFTSDEIATVESVARMAALAIDNASAYHEQKELARRLTSLLEASRAITRADEARPEYKEMVAALRELRDTHPGVRFITTYALAGDTCVTVLDTGQTAAEVSHVGDRWFAHDELSATLAGASLEANVFSADEYGVWVSRCAPIRDARGAVVGAITVDEAAVEIVGRQEAHGDFSQGLASMLQTTTLRYSRAELQAITDGLTGLYNHRYLHERLGDELVRAREEGQSLSVLFVDLDRFKSFNDSRGHKTGDEALCRVARSIEKSIRRIDLAARYGGDEFVVALLDSDAQDAAMVAERLREMIAEESASRDLVTVSIGSATFPADADTKAELLDKADWAMYVAKRAGRDRVVAFSGDMVSRQTEQVSQ